MQKQQQTLRLRQMMRHKPPASGRINASHASEAAWPARINRAEATHGFDELDIVESERWPTCAVGECLGLSPAMPEDEAADFCDWLASEHPQLYDLGRSFPRAVARGDASWAASLYGEIKALCSKI